MCSSVQFSCSAAAAAAMSIQSCLTLCDPIDGSPLGSPVPAILQARTLEWVAISFSNAWRWKVKVKPLSRVQLWATPWTAAHQAPPSMGFSRQEYWSGLPLPSPSLCPITNAKEAEAEWFYEDQQDLLELIPKKDVLFIIGNWNKKVGSQERAWVSGKFGLGVQNEAGQRVTEFCQENSLVIATPSSNNTREDSTHGHHQMVNTKIRLIVLFEAKDGEAL